MPIRVYNRFLDLLSETDGYQSLQYERDYHGIGTFELHINRYMHGADDLQKGNIIALNKQANKVGIIVSREIGLNESGKQSENFVLTGLTMDSIMSRRVTVPPSTTSHDRKSGNAETVMKHYVHNHFINPADKSRKLDMLEIAPNQNRGQHVAWESRFKDIGEELESISTESGLGWGIFVDFNTKKFIFDCFQSRDLTQNNEFGYSPVFFSPEFETVKSQSFIDSDTDYKNVGYIGGQGEGVERTIVELGNASGWGRIETFVDARDVGTEDEDSEEELTEEEIEQMLIDRGRKKMKEMETIFSLEAEILTPITRKSYERTQEGQPSSGQYVSKQQQVTPFQYEKDFDLGDRVQIVNKSWRLTMTAPISKFLEVHEPGGFRLEGTFGQSRPTLITKIKEKFNELEGIEKQEAPTGVAVEYMKRAMKYGDVNLTEEERKRTEQARNNLEVSKEYTEDYTYTKEEVDDKDKDASRLTEGEIGGVIVLDKGDVKIVRPDGAISVSNGLLNNSYAVSQDDPYFMTTTNNSTSGAYREPVFRPGGHYGAKFTTASWYVGMKYTADGRDLATTGFRDVRDAMSAVSFQRYEFIHSSRWLVFYYWNNAASSKHSIHVMENASSDIGKDRLAFSILEAGDSGVKKLLCDLGTPTYEKREVSFKIGWTNNWGPADGEIIFRMKSIVQTDIP